MVYYGSLTFVSLEAASSLKVWSLYLLFTIESTAPGGYTKHRVKICQADELINKKALCKLYSL